MSSISRLIKDHKISCRFSHCVCFDVGDVLRMYVVYENTVETNWQKQLRSPSEIFSNSPLFIKINKHNSFLRYCLMDPGVGGKLVCFAFPGCSFFNLSRTKQLSLHLTDQRTNVTFAVIDAIQTEAILLNNYSLGSQYIRQWFHFRVLLELKAGCA